jgi:hypothetical protein
MGVLCLDLKFPFRLGVVSVEVGDRNRERDLPWWLNPPAGVFELSRRHEEGHTVGLTNLVTVCVSVKVTVFGIASTGGHLSSEP